MTAQATVKEQFRGERLALTRAYRSERVAGVYVAGLKSRSKPLYPLSRCTVRKTVRDHLAPRLPLQSIIPDCRSCLQSLFQVAWIKQLTLDVVGVTPQACEAIGL
jgi:hypothetical protein